MRWPGEMTVRPLDRLNSIKIKLGVVIIAAVIVTVASIFIARRVGIAPRFGIAAATLGALGTILLLARGMIAPLREMAKAAREMERGNYGQRVAATSRDEVGELARAFNHMAAELEHVDLMRKNLIANVSHELKTPISGLRATLENVVDGVNKADTKTLEVMLSQVNRLGDLVNDLLDLSRLESGAIKLQLRTFKLGDLLNRVVQEAELYIHSQFGERELRVIAEVAPHLECTADSKRLHQVLFNIVENAIRHSPQGGTVQLRASQRQTGIELTVDDEGPGIAPEDRDRVFERFYRADDTGSSTDGSSGLGLAIARWIVELHNGKISTSSSEAGGCRFTITLPQRRATVQ